MTPWVTVLLLANIAVYLVTGFIAPELKYVLAFQPATFLQYPWTVITYMFVHEGWMHILFNMIALYFFGPRLELRLGGRRFLTLYFLSGLGGAALSFIKPEIAIIGASGAIMGVLVGYARYWPHDKIYLWAIVPIEARVLLILFVGFEILGGLGYVEPHVAHFAHLGGIAVGYLYLRWIDAHSPAARFKRQAATVAPTPPSAAAVDRWRKIRPDDLHPVNRAEYERIRAKLDAAGPGGLTPSERAFLDRFSAVS